MAFSLLKEAGCSTESLLNAPLLEKQLSAGLNCPLSSGMGRLFDGVSAILGIRETCSYEGQAAILLEAAAGESDACFPVETYLEPAPEAPQTKLLRFDWRPMP